MIETKIICDRCGRKVEGDTYYTIDIYGHSIDPSSVAMSYAASAQNVETSLAKGFGGQKQLCPGCIAYIKDAINGFH